MSLLKLLALLAICMTWMWAIVAILKKEFAKKSGEYLEAFLTGVGVAFSPLLWLLDKTHDKLTPRINARMERRLTKRAKLVWRNDNEIQLIGKARRIIQKRQHTFGTGRLVQIPSTDVWFVLRSNEMVRTADKKLLVDRVGAEELAFKCLQGEAASRLEGNGSENKYGSYWKSQRWQASDGRWYPGFELVWPGNESVCGWMTFCIQLDTCTVTFNHKHHGSDNRTLDTNIDTLMDVLNDTANRLETDLPNQAASVQLGTCSPGPI